MDLKTLSKVARRIGAVPIIVAVAILISILVVSTPLATTLTPYQLDHRYTVEVSVQNNNLFVSVKLPTPSMYYTSYYGYYGYYSYYEYYGYAVTGIPITVIIALAKYVDSVPQLYGLYVVKLVAFGTPNQATVAFYNLEKGNYTLQVMFWNDLLHKLSAAGEPWIPLAYPYTKPITIGG